MAWIALYAFGAAQALMLASILWRREANAQANRILAGWLGIVALDLGVKAAHLAYPGSVPVDAVRLSRLLPFLHASYFYLYVRALTTGRGLRLPDLAHVSAFLFVLGWALWRIATHHGQSLGAPWIPPWFDPLMFLWALGYLAAALWRIHGHRITLGQTRADADRLSMRWLTAMAACQLLIWGVAAAHWLVRLPLLDYRMIYAAVAAWVCVIGWCSISQPPVIVLASPAAVKPPEPAAGPDLDDARVAEVEQKLAELMRTEKLYSEPALSIARLARRSGYPEYLVSLVINRRLGGTFWDYINRHRIEAVCAYLDAGDPRTILEIAYAAGFTSKSTFNASFKTIVGETPSAYRRSRAGTVGSAHTAAD